MQRYPGQTHRLLECLNLTLPLIQAPMAGVSNPTLASTVSTTGALGSLGLGGGSPEILQALGESMGNIARLPINLNFFVHKTQAIQPKVEAQWLRKLAPYFEALGATAPASLTTPYGSFDDDPGTLRALLELQPAVVSFHFGLPSPATMKALKSGGCKILATATSLREALALEQGGADVVIAQGWEAGGHRGHFLNGPKHADEKLSTKVLVEQLSSAIAVPIVAAGGIGNGKIAAELFRSGAAGVQLGTAFVSCPESSASDVYRNALQNRDAKTVMTRVFSGREARGLQNLLTKELHHGESSVLPVGTLEDRVPEDPRPEGRTLRVQKAKDEGKDGGKDQVPDYPRAYSAGKALASAAEQTGDAQHVLNYTAMWAGTAFASNRPMPAAELVALFVEELLGEELAAC